MANKFQLPDDKTVIPLWVVTLILLVVIGVIYSNSLKNPFYYDDFGLAIDNKGLDSWGNLPHLFTQKGYFEHFKESTYRPTISILYLVSKQVFGKNPAAWRSLNLTFHLLNCLLLFLVLRAFKLSDLFSILAAMLFCVHPVHTELFNVVTFNEDLIGGFFCLLAFYWYYKEGAAFRIGSLIAFFISCFAKETFIVLPLLFFLFIGYEEDTEFTFRGFCRGQLGYLALALLFLLINFVWMTNPNPVNRPPYPGGSVFTALLTFSVVLSYYFKIFFIPVGLTAVYDFPVFTSIFTWQVGGSILILGLITAVIVYGYKRRLSFAPYLVWYFLFLLPTSNIIPFWALLAERYLYFPLMGLIPGLLLLFKLLVERFEKPGNKVLTIFVLVVVLLWGGLTMGRNAVWGNPETLWLDTLEKAKNASSPHLSLAILYDERNDFDKAVFHYNKAIELEPTHPLPFSNLARFYSKRGMYEPARENYIKAIALKKSYYDLGIYYYDLLNLADACIQLELYSEAVTHLQLSIRFRPDKPSAYYNLSIAYEEMGRLEESIKAQQQYDLLK